METGRGEEGRGEGRNTEGRVVAVRVKVRFPGGSRVAGGGARLPAAVRTGEAGRFMGWCKLLPNGGELNRGERLG